MGRAHIGFSLALITACGLFPDLSGLEQDAEATDASSDTTIDAPVDARADVVDGSADAAEA